MEIPIFHDKKGRPKGGSLFFHGEMKKISESFVLLFPALCLLQKFYEME